MIEIYSLNESNFKFLISYPSINILPWDGSYILKRRYNSVVLPNPLCPTIAFVVPGSIFKLKLLNNSI